ncbi:hypothetical protein D3C81_1248690 [compost metagenome]|uniref:hypothetical protein n=1 Tax=Pseudomonas TaxID=286 RepID=UPI000F9EA08D|nr:MULTISPECIES: hypothetical protein [Pseudomonas]VVN22675.1 hypothetical protein PS647_04440 [Pseudomonas fluorescens]
MNKFRVVTSNPEWYKGGKGTIFTIHNESWPLRGLTYEVESDAYSVCDALNRGEQLSAELKFKHDNLPQTVTILTALAPAQDVLYYHVQDKLSGTASMSLDSDLHKAQALREAGYSDPVVYWRVAK